MYQGDVARAASLAVHCDRSSCPFSLDESVAEAIRDQAMRAGKYSEALNLFKSVAVPDYYAENIVRFRVVYAHLVALAGNAKESREMAASLLKLLDDTDRAGSVEDWLARDRAAVYALLGDNDGALKELETSQRQNQFTRWWYTGELDPIFKPLHGNPRFQALVANARKHSDEQRALVDAMRKRGEIPLRPAPAASATRTAAN
jgi:tetratricopeptide (TPR) repeat protein